MQKLKVRESDPHLLLAEETMRSPPRGVLLSTAATGLPISSALFHRFSQG